ncbi:unnamed protein product, partial [Effrenium voratum]
GQLARHGHLPFAWRRRRHVPNLRVLANVHGCWQRCAEDCDVLGGVQGLAVPGRRLGLVPRPVAHVLLYAGGALPGAHLERLPAGARELQGAGEQEGQPRLTARLRAGLSRTSPPDIGPQKARTCSTQSLKNLSDGVFHVNAAKQPVLNLALGLLASFSVWFRRPCQQFHGKSKGR